MLRIAVIGTGAMALKHSQVLCRHPGAQLASLCSTLRSTATAEKFRRDFGFSQTTTNFQEVVEDPNIDALFICTPDDTHVKLVVEALEAGKHVFCEKPLARDEAGFELLRKTKARTSGCLQVGMNCRYRAQYSKPKEFAGTEALGNLRYLRGTYLLNKVAAAKSQDKAWWSQRPSDIFFFLHANGVHIIDLIRWIGGRVESVFTRSTAFELGDRFKADTFSSSLQFANGAIGDLLISSVAFQPREIGVEAWYDRGSILGTRFFRRSGDEIAEEGVELSFNQEVPDLHLQFDDFLRAIARGGEPVNNFQEAYENFRLVRAMERSLDSKKPVSP